MKLSLWFVIFGLIIFYIPSALGFELTGKVKISIDIENKSISTPTYSNTLTFSLSKNNNSIGQLRFQLFNVINDSKQQVIKYNNTPVGQILVNLENNTLIINSFKLDFQEFSEAYFFEEKDEISTTIKIPSLKTTSGNIIISFIIDDSNLEEVLTANLFYNNQYQGNFIFDPTQLDIDAADFELTNKTIQGRVYYSDGKSYDAGKIYFSKLSTAKTFLSSFEKGTYGPLNIESKNTDLISFVLNNFIVNKFVLNGNQVNKSYILFKELKDVNVLDFYTYFTSTDMNYKDSDFDGIPDSRDRCPNTNTTIVNYEGCSCSQITCSRGVCVEEVYWSWKIPVCKETCNDGIKNGDETGIDCGGSCDACLATICEKPNSCLSNRPEYCSSDKKIMQNCNQCSCPEGNSCNSNTGECYKEVPAKGLKCKTANILEVNSPVDCQELSRKEGKTYVAEQLGNYIHFSIKGMPKFLKNKVRNARDQVKAITFCVEEKNFGSVMIDTTCPGSEELEEVKKELTGFIYNEIKNGISSKIPALFKGMLKAKITVDLTNLHIATEYPSPPLHITLSKQCEKLVYNGDSSTKADVLFIGDGFTTKDRFKKFVLDVIDYSGVEKGTKKEGLFSREPFQSNKDKFNIWILNSKLNYEKDSSGAITPSLKDVYSLSNNCPQKDYIIVISPINRYRSFCYFGSPCFISIVGEDYPGRLLTHEFGHGFAKLKDEYYNNIESQNYATTTLTKEPQGLFQSSIASVMSRGQSLTGTFQEEGKNCAPSRQSAEQLWGDLASQTKEIGYYPTCGGDCGVECRTNIRPTYNSVMNNQIKTCNIETTACIYGPPFDDWYAVNAREIMKKLEAFKR